MKKNLTKITESFFENIPNDKYGFELTKFEELIVSGDIKEYFLVDVRKKEEFSQERIPGSVNIPYYKFSSQVMDIPLEQKVIIISKRGIIAAQICSLLNACGYSTWTLKEGLDGYMDIGDFLEGEKCSLER
ncbi:MAG: hypothetical protein APF76_14370 [Desulfitibacter sp. BRH_c19]|nr:MAG: hypothetical protein APF76_14370 [Desulfitibacter sp. BRH_c19]